MCSIFFNDKPYQEMNFKGHLNSVLFSKWNKICHISTCPAWFYFALPDCAHSYNKIEKFQL